MVDPYVNHEDLNIKINKLTGVLFGQLILSLQLAVLTCPAYTFKKIIIHYCQN